MTNHPGPGNPLAGDERPDGRSPDAGPPNNPEHDQRGRPEDNPAPGFGRAGADQPAFRPPGQQPAHPPYTPHPSYPPQPPAQQPPAQQGYRFDDGRPRPPGQPPPVGGSPSPGQQWTGGGGDSGRRRLPLIMIGAAAVVVAVVLVIMAVVRGAQADRPAAGGPAASTSPPTASDAVRGYLDALAAGDAAQALRFIEQPPKDRTLLTDAVLKRSIRSAPITDVNVGRPTGPYGAQVTANYRLGEQPVTEEFNVGKRGGTFLIDMGTADVILGSQTDGLKLTVNGVAVSGDQVTVFPGSYRIETSTRYIEIGSDATFTLLSPSDHPEVDLQPTLDSKGQKLFRQKVTAAAKKCVSSTKLDAGCGLELSKKLSDGTVLTDGTVHRTMSTATKSELRHLKGELDVSAPTVAVGSLTGSVDVRVDGTQDGTKFQQGEIFGYGRGTQLGRPSIDMADDKLVVDWD